MQNPNYAAYEIHGMENRTEQENIRRQQLQSITQNYLSFAIEEELFYRRIIFHFGFHRYLYFNFDFRDLPNIVKISFPSEIRKHYNLPKSFPYPFNKKGTTNQTDLMEILSKIEDWLRSLDSSYNRITQGGFSINGLKLQGISKPFTCQFLPGELIAVVFDPDKQQKHTKILGKVLCDEENSSFLDFIDFSNSVNTSNQSMEKYYAKSSHHPLALVHWTYVHDDITSESSQGVKSLTVKFNFSQKWKTKKVDKFLKKSMHRRIRPILGDNRKKWLHKIITLLDLDFEKNIRVQNLSNEELFRFFIAKTIIETAADIIILPLPIEILGYLELKRIFRILEELSGELLITWFLIADPEYLLRYHRMVYLGKGKTPRFQKRTQSTGTRSRSKNKKQNSTSIFSDVPGLTVLKFHINTSDPKYLKAIRGLSKVKLIDDGDQEHYTLFAPDTTTIIPQLYQICGKKLITLHQQAIGLSEYVQFLKK